MNYTAILLAIAPVFFLILFGYGLRRIDFPGADFWTRSNKLVYWVLFPALLFSSTSTISFSGKAVLSYAVVVYAGFGSALIFALLTARLSGLDGPLSTSVLQGSVRHNTFIALAVAERLLGGEGLSAAVLTSALLIPVTNIVVVTLMVVLLRDDSHPDEKCQRDSPYGVVRAVLRDLVRNPLLVAVVIGIFANLLGITPLPVINDFAAILGRAALPLMLIGIGAGIRVRRMHAAVKPVVFSVTGKMVVFPLAILLMALQFGLPQMALIVAVIFGAAPTAGSAYALAQQMGGDAEAMSSIVTIQMAISFFSLPLTLMVVQFL